MRTNWSWIVAATILTTAGCAARQTPSRGVLSEPPPLTGWIDATTTLDPATTPVYEGDAPMRFEFLKDMRKGDALTLSMYSLGAHSGTHIDAPMHFVRDGASIDRVPLNALIGPARVIDVPDSVQAIDAAELRRHDWRGARRVLFRTRSARHACMTSPSFR